MSHALWHDLGAGMALELGYASPSPFGAYLREQEIAHPRQRRRFRALLRAREHQATLALLYPGTPENACRV